MSINDKEDKRVVAKGFGWRRLEGPDQRDIWDPEDKKKTKGCLWLWAFYGVFGLLLVLLPALDYTLPLHRVCAGLALLISMLLLRIIYLRAK